MNLNQLNVFVETLSGFFSIEMVIGIIGLALFFASRFNSWTRKETEYGRARPPRHFTTWGRFVTFTIVYLFIVETTYIILICSPNLLRFIGDVLDFKGLSELKIQQGETTFPLWVMVTQMGLFTHVPGFNQFDENVRQWLHGRAFIPYEARSLIANLTENPACFKPDPKMSRKVVEKYGDAMPGGWGDQINDNRLSSKWFRLTYLQDRIRQWSVHPKAQRYLGNCGEEYLLFKEQFKQLALDLKDYFKRVPEENDERSEQENVYAYIESLEKNLHRELDKLSARVYEFIVCGALSTERTHRRRIAILNYFGLYPIYQPGIPIVMDIVLKNAVIVFGFVTATSIAYLLYLKSVLHLEINIAMGIVWAAISLSMIGLSIFSAVIMYRLMTRKSRFGAVPGNGMVIIGPFVHRCIGFMTGYLCGIVVMLMYNFVGPGRALATSLQKSMPWSLIPAISASYIIHYLTTLSEKRSSIKDALSQGLVTGIFGLMACIWAFDTLTQPAASIVYIITTCVCIGAAIGYFFPSAYFQRVAAFYHGPERRNSPRIALSAKSSLHVAGERINCNMADLSMGGACLNADTSAGVGDRIEMELPGVGRLNSEVLRKTDEEIAVRFHDHSNRKPALRTYIGQMACT